MNTIQIHVVGPIGCGKSAIAGEIEILCKALGLSVSWPEGQSEKNMTGADWQSALEMYKPTVVIHESTGLPEATCQSSECASYRDENDMPTEVAVLKREWLAMRKALSYRPAPQAAKGQP